MKIKKKILLTAGLSIALLGVQSGPSYAESSLFKDVPVTFWGYKSIKWSVDNKIVDGYPDGTFKPGQPVKRDEFIAMLIRAYQPSDLKFSDDSAGWAAPYLNYWTKLGWEAGANTALSRGEVAQILSHAAGKNYTIDDSVNYVLDTGIAQGKEDKSFEGFKKDDSVNRAEAVAFIERLKQYNAKLEPKGGGPTIAYTNTKHHFTVQVPAQWEGKYNVETETYKDSAMEAYHFYNKANREYGGLIFTISVWPKDKWNEESEEISKIIRISKVGERGDRVFTLSFPSDVQYRPDDEKLKAAYLSMYEDVKNQLVVFKLDK
ncbi:S-layer homology domain-containing protein [Paenibacillus elgii]|uniref:S-layer homology domain-containing protein n=1 Tax=Paenibacillus elgii TaxID=189691 RepID=UPI000248D762|nr:S-layer homology domain-containing protein [Paenibacillus elgii]